MRMRPEAYRRCQDDHDYSAGEPSTAPRLPSHGRSALNVLVRIVQALVRAPEKVRQPCVYLAR